MYIRDNLSLQKYKVITSRRFRIYSGFTLLTDYDSSSFIDNYTRVSHDHSPSGLPCGGPGDGRGRGRGTRTGETPRRRRLCVGWRRAGADSLSANDAPAPTLCRLMTRRRLRLHPRCRRSPPRSRLQAHTTQL